MAPRLGLLPSCLMVWRNSGSSGKEKPLFSCLSRAKLFTFQRPNSLQCHTNRNSMEAKDKQHMNAACMHTHLFYTQFGRKLHVNSHTVSDQSLSKGTAIWKLLWDTSVGNTSQRLNPLSWTEHLFWVLEKIEKAALCCDFKVDTTQLAPHEEAHIQICSLPGIKYDVSTTSKWISCATL